MVMLLTALCFEASHIYLPWSTMTLYVRTSVQHGPSERVRYWTSEKPWVRCHCEIAMSHESLEHSLLFIYCWLPWVFVAFSSCSEQGPLSSCSAWASHWGGFSCCGAWSLGAWASVVVAPGLNLPHSIWNPPRPQIKPVSPAFASGFLTMDHQGSPGLFHIRRLG